MQLIASSKNSWIHDGDQLVIVTNAFAHDKVVESIQLRSG